MRLAEQWAEIDRELAPRSLRARVALTVEDEAKARRAALALGPAGPGRSGTRFLIDVCRARGLPGTRPETLRRVLERLDRERIEGTLELVEAEAPGEEGAARGRRAPLARQWDALLERLPSDWSDLYLELQLDSSDFVERGALLLAPVNPARYGGPKGLRFRSARRFGYGAAAEMTRRCLQRLDEERITGELRVVRVLSDTHPVATQGPVFRIGGRSV